MVTHSGKSRLKAILIIDIIIVAVAAGAFLTLQSQGLISFGPKPAAFEVTDLTIEPAEAEVGEPITITFNVTNTGETAGNYTANLTINTEPVENTTMTLIGGESNQTAFTVIQTAAGDYTVEVGNVNGTFTVKQPPPDSSSIVLSGLKIKPYEVTVGETVTITATAKNPTSEPDIVNVKLKVNDLLADSQIVELGGGETATIEFTYTTETEGVNRAKLNLLAGGFTAVPPGMHTLSIGSYPKVGIEFTLDGETHKTPYSEILSEGTYSIKVPASAPEGKNLFSFIKWNDGVTTTSRSVTLTERTSLSADFSGGISCPSLYIWNGTMYIHVAEVSNAGWLGYIGYVNDEGSVIFVGGNPWSCVKLDNTQFPIRNGSYYDILLSQKWDEIFYLDQVYLLVADHSADVTVYPPMIRYMNPGFTDTVYTVGKTLSTPVSAYNENGENVLPQISKLDSIFTPGINGLESSPSWENLAWNRLTIDLGDLSGAPQIKLIMNGMVDWGPAELYYQWIDSILAKSVPNGTEVTPPPYLEVKDANGNWVRVPEDMQIPIPADYIPLTFAADLTGIFLTDDYTIRINNFWNVTYDYIAIDTTPQKDIVLQKIDPTATFQPAFTNDLSAASGNFTRYGDVTQLLIDDDDMFVTGMQGDDIYLQFAAADISPLAEGMERDFFLVAACWFKDPLGNWGYGFNFTVNPLPFQAMSGFPYLPPESYPYDEAHLSYLQEYNTRFRAERSPEPNVRSLLSPLAVWAIAVAVTVAATDVGVLFYFKRRR